MAGQVIVEVHKMFGKFKTKIFVNGEVNCVLLGGEKKTIEIKEDSQICAKVWIRAKTNKIIAKGDEITNLLITDTKGGLVTQLISTKQSDSKHESSKEKPRYDLNGSRGRRIKVFEDRCIFATTPCAGSLLTGNASDGEKTIYYTDVISVQFKKCGYQLGYLQLETASNTMNNNSNNFFNENSFTFDYILDVFMEEVQNFVKQKVDEAKKQKNAPVMVASATSNADELKKFKELLDLGVISQEEFDAKKKQLLGL